VIADCDPMGISAEVLKDTLDAIEGRFTIDDPLLMIEWPHEYLKVPRLFEMADTVREYEIIRLEAFFKKVKKLPFEQSRHHPDWDEKPSAAGDPAASV